MTTDELTSNWITVKEAAAELKRSTEAINWAIRMGYIRGTYQLGHAYLIPIAEWQRYKRERRPQGRPRREDQVEAVA